MGGSATLGTSLVDRLVPMADSLRSSLRGAFGSTQFRVIIRITTWTGPRLGDGSASVVERELTPAPIVDLGGGDRPPEGSEMVRGGYHRTGIVTLREVSLTYTLAELGGTPTALQEVIYILRDGKGQGVGDRTYTLAAPPIPDRDKGIGWVVNLSPWEAVP